MNASVVTCVPQFSRLSAHFRKVRRVMDVVLHVGAHRTGTTTLQAYLRQHGAALARDGVEVWDPRRTRRGLFQGLRPGEGAAHGTRARQRAAGRIALNLEAAEARGTKTLIVTDENMIGSVRENMRARALYPSIGERMARICSAFAGRVSRIVISTRAQDRYWTSACAYGVGRGARVPDSEGMAKIASSKRRWRDVITDLACAADVDDVRVLPFETHLADPSAMLRYGFDVSTPLPANTDWANRAPDLTQLRQILRDRNDNMTNLPGDPGAWQPFGRAARVDMEEAYLDDLFWLTTGAGGLATLIEEDGAAVNGQIRTTPQYRGHDDEQTDRHMA